MGRGRRPFVVAGLVVLLLVPALLFAASRPSAAASTILSIIDGTAQVAHSGAGFLTAADGDIVAAGDRVRTADASHAVITFFDGSTIELEPATTVQVDDASATSDGARSISLFQSIGRTWSSVTKLTKADSKYELRTPTSTAAVRGTGFITDVSATGVTTLQTSDGVVEVTAQGQTVDVAAGQVTTVAQNSPPTQPVPG